MLLNKVVIHVFSSHLSMRLLTSVGLLLAPAICPFWLGAHVSWCLAFCLGSRLWFLLALCKKCPCLVMSLSDSDGMAVFGCSWPFPRSVFYGLAMVLPLDSAGFSLWLLLAILKKCLCLATCRSWTSQASLFRLLLALSRSAQASRCCFSWTPLASWFMAALGRVQEVLPRDVVAPGLRWHLLRFLLAFCFQELCVSISCHYGFDSLVLHTCGPLATLAADGFLKLWRSISLALCA